MLYECPSIMLQALPVAMLNPDLSIMHGRNAPHALTQTSPTMNIFSPYVSRASIQSIHPRVAFAYGEAEA